MTAIWLPVNLSRCIFILMEDAREYVAGLDRAFGARVREVRERRGLSQHQVSLEMQVFHGFPWHQTTVAKTEAGERPIKLAEAVALADALDVRLFTLLHEDLDDQERRAAERAAALRELMAVQGLVRQRAVEIGAMPPGSSLGWIEAPESAGEEVDSDAQC